MIVLIFLFIKKYISALFFLSRRPSLRTRTRSLPKEAVCLLQEDGTRRVLFSTRPWRGGTLTALQRRYRQERRTKWYLPMRRRRGECRLGMAHQRERKRDQKECHILMIFYSFCNSVFSVRRGAIEERKRFIENSLILFLSSRSRVMPGIDRQIHNATWVSELARASAYLPDAATTELAYWALRRPSLYEALLQNVLTRSWRLSLADFSTLVERAVRHWSKRG